MANWEKILNLKHTESDIWEENELQKDELTKQAFTVYRTIANMIPLQQSITTDNEKPSNVNSKSIGLDSRIKQGKRNRIKQVSFTYQARKKESLLYLHSKKDIMRLHRLYG
ncbi:hypothetical protein LOAG_09925 [Loa loa]|uniref:Uncharacterized protein n=1 Tax=Loa loa TaxID=7209 RepID=A0A1S0TS47_LOALO|nr:hypothetical protein LOAG_09925 [Loa loa]EFO18575.1 hypothetical protein LOAG_09925 [Loa loa]